MYNCSLKVQHERVYILSSGNVTVTYMVEKYLANRFISIWINKKEYQVQPFIYN